MSERAGRANTALAGHQPKGYDGSPRYSVARWIDDEDGAQLLSEGLRLDASWDHRRFAHSRRSRDAARQGDWFRPCAEVLDRRGAELWLRFRGRLEEVRVRLLARDGGTPDRLAPRSRDLRHWTWLIESLGAPTLANGGGVLYAFPWGWVHAGCGAIHVSYSQQLDPVPLPHEPGEAGPYRCMRCGAIHTLPYGQVVEVPRTRGGAPCRGCGEVAWVRVGSDAERQRISARPDYCEVGRHMTKGVRSHRLVAKVDRCVTRGQELKTVRVRACAAHRSVLIAGFYGFVLPVKGEGAG